jgi:hypothetical protein
MPHALTRHSGRRRAHWRHAFSGVRRDHAGATVTLPAQREAVGVGRCLVDRIAEHVIEEAHQATQVR